MTRHQSIGRYRNQFRQLVDAALVGLRASGSETAARWRPDREGGPPIGTLSEGAIAAQNLSLESGSLLIGLGI
jgi:hypothetical protein